MPTFWFARWQLWRLQNAALATKDSISYQTIVAEHAGQIAKVVAPATLASLALTQLFILIVHWGSANRDRQLSA